MMNDSIKLAKFWSALHDVKERLDNEMIPIGSYLGVYDPELMIALEDLSARIENHLERFRLTAEIYKINTTENL